MEANSLYSYLGTAVTYPITISDGKLKTTTGLSVIEDSIVKILTTKKGTRFFVPEYGCRLSELMFEPNDEVLLALIRIEALDALIKWETRAEFFDVLTIMITDGVICIIQYRILQSNQIESFIWPLYRSLIY